MKRLSGWDAILLYTETPTVHMHTLKLAVIASGRRPTITPRAMRPNRAPTFAMVKTF